MKHYNQLPLKVLQLIIEREIIGVEKTHDVHLVEIDFDCFGALEPYQQGDGHCCETILVSILVNNETKDYELEWDMEEEEITTIRKI